MTISGIVTVNGSASLKITEELSQRRTGSYIMVKIKKQDNPRKLLRTWCPDCSAEQDSIRVKCKVCNTDLHPGVDSETLASIQTDVRAYEEAYKAVLEPNKGNPYHPLDRALSSLSSLYKNRSFPGMQAFLDGAGKQLLPHRLQLLKRTLVANVALLGILILFALLPVLIGWPLMISGVMALPVVGWGVIAFKAYRQYAEVKKKVDALDSA